MKKLYWPTFFIPFLAFLANAQADDICPKVSLDFPASRAVPVVKVSPAHPGTTGRIIPACAIVSFVLVERPGSNGKALIPDKIKIEASSKEIWNKPLAEAVSKWMYLSKNVDFRGRQYLVHRWKLTNP